MDAPTNTELLALRQLTVDSDRAEELKRQSLEFPSVALTQRQLCDLELLLGGGFTPLTGFMGEAADELVVEGSRLTDGTVWPIPITLDIEEAQAEKLETGSKLALRDTEGFMLAALHVEDIWRPDKQREAEQVYQTNSMVHAGVRYLHEQVKPVYVGGRVEGIQLPSHYDYEELRHTPEELRHIFAKLGWRRVVGFHTSRPMHRLQRELTMRAAKEAEAHILVHPVVGMTKPRDLAYHARVRCYQAIEKHYPHSLTALSLLPLAMRMAGPREALWHALVRRNYGCTHFIVGPDHASPPREDGAAEDFYEADAARELVGRYEGEIGIQLVPFDRHCYAPARREFIAVSEAKAANEPCEELSSKELAD